LFYPRLSEKVPFFNGLLDQLTGFFRRHGFATPALGIGAPLFAFSSHTAPAGLAASAATAGLAAAHSAASTSTLTLIKGALKIMAWSKTKTAIVAGAAVILAAGVTTSIIVHDVHQKWAMASKAELTEDGNGAYGLYIHYGIATFANPGEKGTIPASRFAPASLDVQSWAHAAKKAGMTFAVLTAKHESGFCLWDSQDYSYDVGGSPFKGDIIGDFIAACKAEGVAPGVHYSIPDEFNEGAVRYNGAVVSPAYFDIIKKHVTELHTLYPDLRVQIFDMSERLSQAQFDELRQIVNRLNPQCIVWGTVRGQAPNHNSDTVIQSWMWTPNARLNQAQSLFGHYQQSQKAKKAFVLNVAPDRTGRIPDDQLAVLMQVKKLID
jgi:alpha-L-fucosidase